MFCHSLLLCMLANSYEHGQEMAAHACCLLSIEDGTSDHSDRAVYGMIYLYTGVVGFGPTRGMDVCLRLFCV
jgi:hypothetical protein